MAYELMPDWFAPITSWKGVGDKLAEKLANLQIYTIGDLLLHFPLRYEDRSHIMPIQDILPKQSVLIQGQIITIKEIRAKKKRVLITLADPTGTLTLVFFHYHPSQVKQWQEGVVLRCYGSVKLNGKELQMVHPEYQIIKDNEIAVVPPCLIPIYPITFGLTQNWLRKVIYQLLDAYIAAQIPKADPFAALFSIHQPMQPWCEALNTIHRPTHDALPLLLTREHPAFQRLIVEELCAYHLSMQQLRQEIRSCEAPKLVLPPKTLNNFLQHLPFALTPAQERAWGEIRQDLSKDVPMLRLVQGDVGCGKTIVAALAALTAVASAKQVAIMVPTEILAEQHFNHFNHWFAPLGYRCELLVSKLKAKEKRSVQENITMGLTQIAIGTQALFQEDIQFNDLGLVIIDEQHRFGVHQRFALQMKAKSALNSGQAHQLIMTATPIPRTLAMSHYAHVDISIIDSLPPGRQPITTLALPQSRREEVIAKMTNVCESGQQIYWVCTLIEESEHLQCQAAEVAAQQIQAALPQQRVGLVHGRMDNAEKEKVMKAFYEGAISILVATTVIEVGVNVPNATLMIIENPERLGLAQLHQLRGRVGRGNQASICILLYSLPLGQMAKARLNILRESVDGFVIAEADLKLRGPGEILGTRQTGSIQFKVADLQRDRPLLQSLPAWLAKMSEPQPWVEQIIRRWCGGLRYRQA